jgi:hypothetical protein
MNIWNLSFVPPEYMEEYLNIKPGAVSVMGLMNNRGNHVNGELFHFHENPNQECPGGRNIHNVLDEYTGESKNM